MDFTIALLPAVGCVGGMALCMWIMRRHLSTSTPSQGSAEIHQAESEPDVPEN
jgi:hypothetical protein